MEGLRGACVLLAARPRFEPYFALHAACKIQHKAAFDSVGRPGHAAAQLGGHRDRLGWKGMSVAARVSGSAEAGGTSPALNPSFSIAGHKGATNRVPFFESRNGPTREVRFLFHDDGTRDGSVHQKFTVAGRSDAPNCTLAQPDFESAAEVNGLAFRIPTPLFGLGLVDSIPDQEILAHLAEDVRPFDIQDIEEAGQTVRPVRQGEGIGRIRRCTGTWRIPADHHELVGQILELTSPDPGIQRETVEENERRSLTGAPVRDGVSVVDVRPHQSSVGHWGGGARASGAWHGHAGPLPDDSREFVGRFCVRDVTDAFNLDQRRVGHGISDHPCDPTQHRMACRA